MPLGLQHSRGSVPTTTKQSKVKDPHSVRMGELAVTALSTQDESADGGYEPRSATAPHHGLAVHMRVENMANQFPRTELGALLQVEPYNRYPASFSGKVPLFQELLPGQAVEFDFLFSVRDGTRPMMLILKAESIRNDRCTAHPNGAQCGIGAMKLN